MDKIQHCNTVTGEAICIWGTGFDIWSLALDHCHTKRSLFSWPNFQNFLKTPNTKKQVKFQSKAVHLVAANSVFGCFKCHFCFK